MSDVSDTMVAIASLITAVGGFIAIVHKLNTIHTTFNAKMDKMLKLTEDFYYAKGVQDEKEKNGGSA